MRRSTFGKWRPLESRLDGEVQDDYAELITEIADAADKYGLTDDSGEEEDEEDEEEEDYQ